jgi:Zn-dependent protease with chaperone function
MNPNRVLGLSPKAQDFYNYLDKHISNNTDKSKLQSIGKYNALSIIFTVLFFVAILGGVILYAFYEGFSTGLVLVGIAAIVFLILAIVFYNTLKNKKKINRTLLTNATPKDIYHKYFELAFPNSPLKFEGIEQSTLYGGANALVFTVNGERIK